MRHLKILKEHGDFPFTENVENEEKQSVRKEIKNLIKSLKEKNPNVDINILRSTVNVNVDTLIGYEENGTVHKFLDIYNKRKNSKKIIDTKKED